DSADDEKSTAPRKRSLISRLLGRMVSLLITLVILAGLSYLGWLAFQPKSNGAGGRGAGAHAPDVGIDRGRGIASTGRNAACWCNWDRGAEVARVSGTNDRTHAAGMTGSEAQ
ncbi:hypothetical protein, partial [Escherichia coli]|uniref:hypothetical protein n=1 Tax=Escherichia coli TaxID=562 RepID=UPI0019151E3D